MGTALLTLGLLAFYLRRTLPNILEDVAVSAGEQITESIQGVLGSPQVKQAMSIMGKKSGVVRADTALKKKVAKKVMGQNVIVSKALEYFDITPLEGLSLMQDPTFGPIIQGLIAKGTQGIGKALGGVGGSPSPNRGNGGVGYS